MTSRTAAAYTLNRRSNLDDNSGSGTTGSNAISAVAIAGIVIGIVILLSIFAAFYACYRMKKNRDFQRSYRNGGNGKPIIPLSGAPPSPVLGGTGFDAGVPQSYQYRPESQDQAQQSVLTDQGAMSRSPPPPQQQQAYPPQQGYAPQQAGQQYAA